MDYRAAILLALRGRVPMQTHEIAAQVGRSADKRDWKLAQALTAMKKEGAIRVAKIVIGPSGFARNVWEIAT